MKKIDVNSTKDLPQRKDYADGILNWLDAEFEKAAARRKEYTISAPAEIRRDDLKKQLGYPLWNSPKKNKINVRRELLSEDEKFTAYRMQLEVIEDLWLYGIYFEPVEKREKNPFVLLQHGGLGTPETISGLIAPANYNDVGRDLIESGYYVFAPQLLIWDMESFGIPYNQHAFDRSMKQLGGSKTAFEVYCLTRALDYFETLSEIDSERIGMAGLSYGGMYTLFTAAVEPRIKVAVSSCFVNDRRTYGWSDWVYQNQANTFFDAELLTLVSPRYIFAEMGANDDLFDSSNYPKIKAEYEYYKEKMNLPDNCVIHLFEGTHEFAKDGKNLEFLKKFL